MKTLFTVFLLSILYLGHALANCEEKQKEWGDKPKVEFVNIEKNDDFKYLNQAYAKKKKAELVKQLASFERVNFTMNLYEVDFENKTETCKDANQKPVKLQYAKYSYDNTDSTLISTAFKDCRTTQINILAGIFSNPDRIVELTALGLDANFQSVNYSEDYSKAYPAVKETFKVPHGVTIKKGVLTISSYLAPDPEKAGELKCVSTSAATIEAKLAQAMDTLYKNADPSFPAFILEQKKRFRIKQFGDKESGESLNKAFLPAE